MKNESPIPTPPTVDHAGMNDLLPGEPPPAWAREPKIDTPEARLESSHGKGCLPLLEATIAQSQFAPGAASQILHDLLREPRGVMPQAKVEFIGPNQKVIDLLASIVEQNNRIIEVLCAPPLTLNCGTPAVDGKPGDLPPEQKREVLRAAGWRQEATAHGAELWFDPQNHHACLDVDSAFRSHLSGFPCAQVSAGA